MRQAGIAGLAPAIAAAVQDALRGLDVAELTRPPFTPAPVLSHLAAAPIRSANFKM